VTHLSVTLPSEVNDQSQVQLRIMTTNAAGNDEWVGVDNISVTSAQAPPDVTAPTLVAETPIDGGTTSAGSDLVLRISETVKAGLGDFTLTSDSGDSRVISAADTTQVKFVGNVVTINPTTNLVPDTTYHLSVAPGTITDRSGNAYGGTGGDPIDFRTLKTEPKIFEIQGDGHVSAYDGFAVTTEGVVTAIDTTGSRGFWIQDADGDGNSATSDAVFVFVGSTAPITVQVGDAVRVSGVVDEFVGSNSNNLTTTEITAPTITKIGTGVIAPTVIGADGHTPPTEIIDNDQQTVFDPQQDGLDFYESLEGMLVTIPNAQATDLSDGGSTWVVANGGAGATGMNAAGGVTISAGDMNPERLQVFVDNGVLPGTAPSYVMGDHLGDVTGVVSYFGGQYEVLATSIGSTASQVSLPDETTALTGDATHLTIGAYNLENLDPTDPQAKFEALARDIVANLRAPDIMGVEEIQDADGAGSGTNYSGGPTLQKLIDAIVAAGGPRYEYVEVAPTVNNSTGGESNGNIRGAFLYNPDRVAYVEGSARLIPDNDLSNGDTFNNSRAPLAVDFVFRGETVTAIDVHNTSRLGSEALFGQHQPATDAGDTRRFDQTGAVRDYVEGLLTASPGAHVAVMGDFNGFQFESAQVQLEAGGLLTNLTRSLPTAEQYSYVFEGNAQQIDHLFASSGLAAKAEFDIVHLNAGHSVETRPTDHDPVLGRFLVNTGPVAVGDTAVVFENQSVVIDVLGNDTDANTGEAKTLVSVSLASGGGSVSLVDGKVVYAANADAFDLLGAGQTADDSFTYVMKDLAGATSTATVAVTVTGVADGPAQAGGNGADTLIGTAAEERLDGGNGSDSLSGQAGADTLLGANGSDVLDGGVGSDRLSGGNGPDRFVFAGAFGRDVIADFDRGPDKIQLDDAQFHDFADVMAHASQVGGAVVISYDADNTITLLDTGLSSLRPSDFLFA
jgi:predicted extracellular nuclease